MIYKTHSPFPPPALGREREKIYTVEGRQWNEMKVEENNRKFKS